MKNPHTIILFFLIIWGLGFSLIRLIKIKEPENIFERLFLRLGSGLGLFSILIVVFGLLRIQLLWYIFLILSLIIPLYSIYKKEFSINRIKSQLKLTKSNIYAVLIIIFALAILIVYVKGAFVYPYLEDDDSWDHAFGSKYISEYKTYSINLEGASAWEAEYGHFPRNYLEPYPPTYDAIMGLLHQTNNSINWTLKFFNALIIALGLLFFYLFAYEFTKNRFNAMIATFVLLITPSFMSHFIWSQTLALVLFFPALYFTERLSEDNRYIYIAIISIAAVLVSQPSSAVFFGLFFVIYLVGHALSSHFRRQGIVTDHTRRIFWAGAFGLLLSMIYWIPTFIKFGVQTTLTGVGVYGGLFTASNVDTSGGLVYGIMDFMIAPLSTKMDQPIGWGVFLFFLIVFGFFILLFNFNKIKSKSPYLIVLLWFIISFLGVEGNALPFKLFPHRFWAFLAIPAAFIVAYFVASLWSIKKKGIFFYVLMFVIVIGLFVTSAYPKYFVETSAWPAGGSWLSGEEINGYVWLKDNLPKNTPVFNICSDHQRVIGMDMYSPPIDVGVRMFKRTIFNRSVVQIHDYAKSRGFEYITLDLSCTDYGKDVERLSDLLDRVGRSTDNFEFVYQTQGMWLFKVK